jgi:hypothetical protein
VVSNRLKSTATITGRVQRIAAKVSRNEKRTNASLAEARNGPATNTVGSDAIADQAVTTEQLGRINEIRSDFRLDLIVGDSGSVTLQGGIYSADRTYILGTDTSGSVVQLPLPVRYGTVDSSYTSGAAQVRLDGQGGVTGPYKYISGYTPAANDRVVLLWDYVGSYVISGKLLP